MQDSPLKNVGSEIESAVTKKVCERERGTVLNGTGNGVVDLEKCEDRK